MHGRLEQSLFSHGKIAIGTEKGASRLDETQIVESDGAYRLGENRLFLFRVQFYHGKTTIVPSDRAHRRGENRLFLFQVEFYHEKTTIVPSDRAYRRGESCIILFRLQFSHEKTSIGKVKLACRLDGKLI